MRFALAALVWGVLELSGQRAIPAFSLSPVPCTPGYFVTVAEERNVGRASRRLQA